MALIWEPITVTVEDAMRLSSLGRSYLYECLADGRIASVKVGKRRLVNVASLKAFLTAPEKESSCTQGS